MPKTVSRVEKKRKGGGCFPFSKKKKEDSLTQAVIGGKRGRVGILPKEGRNIMPVTGSDFRKKKREEEVAASFF